MSLRQVFCALFLLGLLLHAHAGNARKDFLRRKLSSASSSSLLETKATQKEKAKYFPQQPIETLVDETPQYQPQQEMIPPQQQMQLPPQQEALPPQQDVSPPQQQDDRFAQKQNLPSLGDIASAAGKLIGGPNAGQPAGSNGRITGAADRISNSDSSCVACQYFVQTMTNSMSKYSVLFASMPSPTSQGSVTSYPPYYNQAAYHPPLLPYGGSYSNAVMSPFSRIGMIEEKAKINKKTASFVQETELPQPDKAGNPPAYGTPRRYRSADMNLWRDRLNRIDTVNPPNPDPLREQARYLESQLFAAVYQNFEGLCASRVPELFIPFCQPMLDKFHIIAEGLHYGDRPDQICMRNDFCAVDSYIRKLPHAVFNPHTAV